MALVGQQNIEYKRLLLNDMIVAATGSTVTINCRQIACDFYSRTRLLHKIITITIYLLYLFLVAYYYYLFYSFFTGGCPIGYSLSYYYSICTRHHSATTGSFICIFQGPIKRTKGTLFHYYTTQTTTSCTLW